MPGVKTNERPGTRAVLRHCRMSATKARQVLDLIRGQEVGRANEILASTPREAATIVAKLLNSALANAVHNDGLDAEELYVAACFADEGGTLKRWRPRARGRATRIRKRTCHITIIVARLPEERLERLRAQREAAGAQRSRRVAESRRRADLSGRLTRRRHARAEAEAAAAAEAEAAEEDEEFEDDDVVDEDEIDVEGATDEDEDEEDADDVEDGDDDDDDEVTSETEDEVGDEAEDEAGDDDEEGEEK